MLAELERLVQLQQLDSAVDNARQTIDAFPGKSRELDVSVAEHTARLQAAEQRLADQRKQRQGFEKDLAAVQTRLARFKDQLMAVKTNKEYHAMQSEIASAEADVLRLEDRILERMLEGDEAAVEVDAARQALEKKQAEVADARRVLEADQERLQAQVDRHAADRSALVAEIAPRVMAMFETVARGRKGVAVSEVRDGRCRACQVRLRPQLYNEVRLNDALIQCESCQRFLYFPLATEQATTRS